MATLQTGFPLTGTTWTTSNPSGKLTFNEDNVSGSFTPTGGTAVTTYWNQSGFSFAVQTDQSGGFPAGNTIWLGTYTGPANPTGSGTCTVCEGEIYTCSTFSMDGYTF